MRENNFRDVNCAKCGGRSTKGHLCDFPPVESSWEARFEEFRFLWRDKDGYDREDWKQDIKKFIRETLAEREADIRGKVEWLRLEQPETSGGHLYNQALNDVLTALGKESEV